MQSCGKEQYSLPPDPLKENLGGQGSGSNPVPGPLMEAQLQEGEQAPGSSHPQIDC